MVTEEMTHFQMAEQWQPQVGVKARRYDWSQRLAQVPFIHEGFAENLGECYKREPQFKGLERDFGSCPSWSEAPV